MRTHPSPLALGAIMVCSTLASGCGPFGYLKKVARDADRAVAKAEAAGAEELAPYEYWGAKAYLEQAKILMGYSEYQRSFEYGDRARQLAEVALEKAERSVSGATRETVEGLPSPEEGVVDDDAGESTARLDRPRAAGAAAGGASR